MNKGFSLSVEMDGQKIDFICIVDGSDKKIVSSVIANIFDAKMTGTEINHIAHQFIESLDKEFGIKIKTIDESDAMYGMVHRLAVASGIKIDITK